MAVAGLEAVAGGAGGVADSAKMPRRKVEGDGMWENHTRE